MVYTPIVVEWLCFSCYCVYLNSMYQYQISFYRNALLIIEAYIYCWLTFLINKLIICQDAREKRFLLYYLKDILTRSLFLLFYTIL